MKTRLLITGFGLLVFGLANLFSYLPISFGPLFLNTPFPFEHIQIIFRDDGGITRQIGYMPIGEAINDPYWLAWSLALYGGIAIIIFAVRGKRK